mmetsp:Transcript_108904/g.302830  ORF Transcript_108904/g.302830 Transcript_108904/m.302830 type:complete len:329 (+) Transcript_108904:250-1236(+)
MSGSQEDDEVAGLVPDHGQPRAHSPGALQRHVAHNLQRLRAPVDLRAADVALRQEVHDVRVAPQRRARGEEVGPAERPQVTMELGPALGADGLTQVGDHGVPQDDDDVGSALDAVRRRQHAARLGQRQDVRVDCRFGPQVQAHFRDGQGRRPLADLRQVPVEILALAPLELLPRHLADADALHDLDGPTRRLAIALGLLDELPPLPEPGDRGEVEVRVQHERRDDLRAPTAQGRPQRLGARAGHPLRAEGGAGHEAERRDEVALLRGAHEELHAEIDGIRPPCGGSGAAAEEERRPRHKRPHGRLPRLSRRRPESPTTSLHGARGSNT